MRMNVIAATPFLLLGLFSIANAADADYNNNNSDGFLRGGGGAVAAAEESGSSGASMMTGLEQFSCTLSGGTDKETCDSSKSEDGSKCVWCAVTSYGVCVSDAIAQQMKQIVPTIDCDDDDGSDDDDKAPPSADDDKKDDDSTPPDDEDDEISPTDDTVPDDYWKCLTKYSALKECTAAKCAWCESKAGFGICMDEKAGEHASESDWFEKCSMPDSEEEEEEIENGANDDAGLGVEDPTDPSCVFVNINGGDESSCKSTKDAEGNSCEWCGLQSFNVCLNADQANIAEQYGASCDNADNDNDKESPSSMVLSES